MLYIKNRLTFWSSLKKTGKTMKVDDDDDDDNDVNDNIGDDHHHFLSSNLIYGLLEQISTQRMYPRYNLTTKK